MNAEHAAAPTPAINRADASASASAATSTAGRRPAMISSQPPAPPDRTSGQVPTCATRSLTTLAQTQLAQGHRQPALALLRFALLGADLDMASPPADLITAAMLYADTLDVHEHGDWRSLRWARRAHQAATAAFGADDEHTIHAARTLARVLAAYRLDNAAIELRQQIVEQLTSRNGRAHAGVLAARADLAIAQHAAGQCSAAITGLTRTWQQWRQQYGDADLDSITMLLQLAAMLDACGQHDAAARRIAQAWRAYRTPVSPDIRTPARLSVDWLTEPDRRHARLCRGAPRSTRLGNSVARLRQLTRGWWRSTSPTLHPHNRACPWQELLP
ncbi:hypothetical protein ABZS66_28190 [Dactylosporangium sp. NPDC005572]|uniref:hypothetical protein n=1 Tax=Dactylosporangium sp. NPDC005572 TaxID=3156889 RepID=UPI0033A14AE5